MPDEADDLIRKMRHLAAAAREAMRARALAANTARLRTALQRMAAEAQAELAAAERDGAEGEEKAARARTPGLAALTAADLLAEGRDLLEGARGHAVKARARLNFALDKMDQAERREWEALQAEARSEAHAQLADSGDDSSVVHAEKKPAGDAGGEG
jgi:hypothetical protein